ncbi:MAG: outer membrane lipoprotein-sorting protein [Candidatus Solibacter usitatus]|nr:outer membrane lipoprotein-sorting protein [Candidatus Solibacter usitatus]
MSRAWLGLILSAATGFAQDARQIMQQAQDRAKSASQRYEGTLQVLDGKSKITEKRWTYQRTGAAGDSKAVLRFTAPAEVKGVALLVVNHPDRASDQWMWTPSLQRERRIAFQDRSTRFFGTDFSFEDLEERDVSQFDYQLADEEQLGGAAVWKVISRPKKTKSSQYSHAHLWVDKQRFVIVKIESFKDARLIRRIVYRDFRQVQGIWTPFVVEVEDTNRKGRTMLKTDKLEYNLPLKEENFTLQALRRES